MKNKSKSELRMYFRKQRTQNAGITLIALVVTIIILLILAGITVSMVTQGNGIFSRAKNASNTYKDAEARETTTLAEYEDELQKTFDEYNNEDSTTSGGTTITTTDENGNRTTITITADNACQYYGTAVDYSPSTDTTGVYRIFYYDATGEFGDGEGTIYLKRDWETNDTELYKKVSNYTPSSIENTRAKMLAMNPEYREKSGRTTIEYENLYENEKETMWLCDENNFSKYKVATGKYAKYVNYVIGGPSVEMYEKSYNSVEHPTTQDNMEKLKVEYSTNNAGYEFKSGLAYDESWYMAFYTIDYRGYNSMYCGSEKTTGEYYWSLASPFIQPALSMCVGVDGKYAKLERDMGISPQYGVCPLVSLKTGVQLAEIKEENGTIVDKEKSILSNNELYYAEVDGKMCMIFADLVEDKSGEWSNSNGTYSWKAQNNLKEYYEDGTYVGAFGKGKVIATKNTTGNDRFYVMALEDVDSDDTGYYWYYDAYENLDSNYSIDSDYNDFGEGKANTARMVNAWNSEKYGKQNQGKTETWEPYRDMWDIIQNSKFGTLYDENNDGWFVASKSEWAAFINYVKTIIGSQTNEWNWEEYNLSSGYWTSTQYGTR